MEDHGSLQELLTWAERLQIIYDATLAGSSVRMRVDLHSVTMTHEQARIFLSSMIRLTEARGSGHYG